MNGLVFIVAAALCADVGWEPHPDGRGVEYIIQFEPHEVDLLRDGQVIYSDIPEFLGEVRSYRIQVGTEPPPQEMPPVQEPAADPAAAAETPDPQTTDVEEPPPQSGTVTEEEPSIAGHEPASTEVESPPAEAAVAETQPSSPTEGALQRRPTIERPEVTEEPVLEAAPGEFVADSTSRPMVNHAGYRDESEAAADATQGNARRSNVVAARTEPAEPSKPWWALTLTLLGLFASMGGNCFLGWMTWDFRGRYRRLLDDMKFRRKRGTVDNSGQGTQSETS